MAAFDQLIDRFANVGNAAETAYAVLREAIVTNTLRPGTRLRADDLAKKLGVSKTPVREALRKLQAEDLITVQPGNALTVKSISEEQLFEIYYTREALEGMAARLAAENAGQIELAKLRAVHDEMKVPSVAATVRSVATLSICESGSATNIPWNVTAVGRPMVASVRIAVPTSEMTVSQ